MSSSSAFASSTSTPPTLESLHATLVDVYNGLDTFFLLWGAIMVFFMQCGFAMLETGCVSVRNTKNVVLKGVADASIGAICWWLCGYGFAFGTDVGHFIGNSKFAFEGGYFTTGYAYASWLYQWAFAASTVTIVSGAVAERINFNAYLVYCVVLTAFIYPVIVHSVWSVGGWASSFSPENVLLFGCGAIDFAGSGVVHMTGGTCALMACIIVGPRVGRFNEDGTVNKLPQQSAVLQALGVFILWFGWYGFNGASTLYIKSAANQFTTARVMVTTTLGATSGGVMSLMLGKIFYGFWDPGALNNGVLGGLVAITAPCSVVTPAGAFCIGVVAACFYHVAAVIVPKVKLDDVVEAIPVHLSCGVWGVLSVGFFASKTGYDNAYYSEYADGSSRTDHCAGVFYGGPGYLLAAQICYILGLFAWAGSTSFLMFFLLDKTIGMRVTKEMEELGMDASKHGGETYPEYRSYYAKNPSFIEATKPQPPVTAEENKAPEAMA